MQYPHNRSAPAESGSVHSDDHRRQCHARYGPAHQRRGRMRFSAPATAIRALPAVAINSSLGGTWGTGSTGLGSIKMSARQQEGISYVSRTGKSLKFTSLCLTIIA